MINNSPNASLNVSTRRTLFGDYVEVEFPFTLLDPEEAEHLAQLLTLAAHIVRERRTEPETRVLPLSEAFSLEAAGASGAQTRQSGKPAGDNFGGSR